MSKTEEIIRRYAEAPDPVEGFGAWLVLDRDSAAKDAALAALWTALEAAPAVDDATVREEKLAALLGRLNAAPAPSDLPAPVSAARPVSAGSIGRRILRFSWIPLAAAAAMALFVVLHRPFDGSPVEFVPKNGVNPEQSLISEAFVPKNADIPEQNSVSTSATAHQPTSDSDPVCKTTPNCTPEAEKTPSSVQITPDLHTAPAGTAPGTAPEPAGTEPAIEPSPDPWKAMEEEDRQSAKRLARKRRTSIAVFGAGGALSQAKGPIHKSNTVAVINELEYSGSESDWDLTVEAPSNPPSNPESNVESNPLGERATHDLPLNFGISLRIPVALRLSLESGITYGFLHSTAGNLHYLGLPLYLQCDILRGQRAGVYVSGGGSLSYCIAGGGKEHPWQPSASVSAGAEYRIFKGVSVFGEASFSHYFDDGSSLETYYSLNSDTPSFRAGLRFVLSK